MIIKQLEKLIFYSIDKYKICLNYKPINKQWVLILSKHFSIIIIIIFSIIFIIIAIIHKVAIFLKVVCTLNEVGNLVFFF
jgi:hypothetical protein